MATFPTLLAGQRFTAARARQMVENVVWKNAATDRSAAGAAVLALDPELSGITLTPGTYLVGTVLMFTAPGATPGFRNAWAFTGVINGGNRRVLGPPPTGTNNSTATLMFNRAVGFLTAQNFIHDSGAAYGCVEEEGVLVVTATGDFGITWAQVTQAGDPTSLKAGSYVKIKQIG